MNTLLKDESTTVSAGDSENVTSKPPLSQPVSFRKCRGGFRNSLKKQTREVNFSWDRILKKARSASAEIHSCNNEIKKIEAKSVDRRKFPRHPSEAVVLAFNRAESETSDGSDHSGDKGYVINVSQNGISFASRFQFNLRNELQLHLEEQFVNCTLDLIASVVRVTSIDDQFWRIDCKLVTALTENQVLLLKEHVPSCYAM